jgi:hypothetical protein
VTEGDSQIPAEVLPKIAEILDAGAAHIETILNIEQRERFRQIVTNRRQILDQMQKGQ